MRHFGKVPRLLLAAALFLAAAASQAAVTAGLDRDRVNMGDTLRLTITADDAEQIHEKDGSTSQAVQAGWQVEAFSEATGRTQGLRSRRDIPNRPNTFYRFVLTEE